MNTLYKTAEVINKEIELTMTAVQKYVDANRNRSIVDAKSIDLNKVKMP